MAEQWFVKTRDAFGQYSRTLFAGIEKDARTFIEQNFPRLHVEPGSYSGEDGPAPDAVLVGADKSVQHFNGADWVKPGDAAEIVSTADGDVAVSTSPDATVVPTEVPTV
jgi:hypothetical protein